MQLKLPGRPQGRPPICLSGTCKFGFLNTLQHVIKVSVVSLLHLVYKPGFAHVRSCEKALFFSSEANNKQLFFNSVTFKLFLLGSEETEGGGLKSESSPFTGLQGVS